MGQWSGGSPYGGGPTKYAAPPYAPTPFRPAPARLRLGVPAMLQVAGLVVIAVLLVGVVALAIAYTGASGKLTSVRSSLRATRAQLASVQGALATDAKALQVEEQVGIYMRGVRDALAPALAAYQESGNASTAAAARADDEQAISALTAAGQKISDLVLPDSLKTADGHIRSAMGGLAAGLQAEVTAIGSGSFSGLDAALTAEGQALDHLQSALGEMYSSVGTAGPASGTS
ncbi:MAG TPA: hypothetical protein VET24_15060 [Actinomycetota bacterium]|nr:hypothetical protein [Actinomycetota bacterium]